MSLTAPKNLSSFANTSEYLDDRLRPYQEQQETAATTETDNLDLHAIITDLHAKFPSDKNPLIPASSVSSMSSLDSTEFAEIKPYDYAIHDLRRGANAEAQRSNMSLSVQSSDSATPNPFPELHQTPVIQHVSTESKTEPGSPILPGKGMTRSLTPPFSGNNNIINEDISGFWAMKLLKKAEERRNSETKRRVCVNFYNEDSSYKTMVINEALTANEMCNLLVLKNHAVQDKNWVLVESVGSLNLERSVEDHELVLKIVDSWNLNKDNKFYFRKDFKKFDFFQNPALYFPSKMTGNADGKDNLSEKAERQRQVLLQNLISSTDRLPDLQGYLHMKEAGKKSWKKAFFVLRGSGLYYSNKGTSKEPKHLVTFCQFMDTSVYIATNAKKTFHSPNAYAFCIKSEDNCSKEAKDLKCLCAEDENTRMCWMAGIRLAKHGRQLQENYRTALRRQEKLKNIDNGGASGPSSDSGTDPKARVAMDFTGQYGGRVVIDPNEALGVAIEEGHHWRRKINRPSGHSPGGRSPVGKSSITDSPSMSQLAVTAGSLTIAQPWFHSGLSRDQANEIIAKQGLVDGVFLIRESKMIPCTFVLSFAHNQKVKHFQISPQAISQRQALKVQAEYLRSDIPAVEENGNIYYTLDGNTKFADLIQLVDFYQLNAGGLPAKLAHHVTKLA